MAAPQSPRPAILDTDIGTDVDDILALVLLARAPEVEFVGVTTVYGDTLLRARMVRRVLDQLGLSDVPVGIGARETLANRPVFWAGHEGEGILERDLIEIDETLTAADLLRQAATEHAGTLDLFAIGPLTNVAAAITADAAFAPAIHHLYVMGGAFWMEQPEHNVKSDPEAADIVFRAGIPITTCGLDVTLKAWLREADMPRLRDAAGGIGPLLEDQVRRWWAYTNANKNPLHDPLAVLPALRPELFRFEHCDVTIDVGGEETGRTRVRRCGEGDVRIVADVDVANAEEEIVRRVVE